VGSTTAPAGGTVVAVVAVVLFGFELELELGVPLQTRAALRLDAAGPTGGKERGDGGTEGSRVRGRGGREGVEGGKEGGEGENSSSTTHNLGTVIRTM